jgi:hypothetical protein
MTPTMPWRTNLLGATDRAETIGRTLTAAALYRRDRETAEELRALNAELAEVNRRLAARRGPGAAQEDPRKLAAAVASGKGEEAITRALRQPTRLVGPSSRSLRGRATAITRSRMRIKPGPLPASTSSIAWLAPPFVEGASPVSCRPRLQPSLGGVDDRLARRRR